MKTDDFLERVRDQLDKMGYKEYISLKYGHILVQINFVNGEPDVTIRERSTERI